MKLLSRFRNFQLRDEFEAYTVLRQFAATLVDHSKDSKEQLSEPLAVTAEVLIHTGITTTKVSVSVQHLTHFGEDGPHRTFIHKPLHTSFVSSLP